MGMGLSQIQFFSAPQQVRNLSVFSLNVNQWGDLGRVPDKDGALLDTQLNYKDRNRAENLTLLLREGVQADLFCGTEFFDPAVCQSLWERTKDRFPYAVMAPAGQGIPGVVGVLKQRYPFIFNIIMKYPEDRLAIANHITSSHYKDGKSLGNLILSIAAKNLASEDNRLKRATADCLNKYLVSHSQNQSSTTVAADMMQAGGLSAFVNENRLFGSLNWALNGPFWGSGLFIMSRYPFLQGTTEFIPHPEVADLEHFTEKGILKSVICLPDGKLITILVTHVQEGVSREAKRVRSKQVKNLGRVADASRYPVIMAADLNDIEGSQAYNTLINGGRRVYRDVYPTLHDDKGLTYIPRDPPNEVARSKGTADSEAASEKPTRIDLGITDLDPLTASVMECYKITDHKGLHFTVSLGGYDRIVDSRSR